MRDEKNDIHTPDLPGTKTYHRDLLSHGEESTGAKDVQTETPDSEPDSHYGEANEPLVKMNVPEKTVAVQAAAKRIEQEEEKHRDDSILTDRDDVFDVGNAFAGEAETGTIVTDKRQPRSKFVRMVSAAFDEWLDDTTRSFKKMRVFQKEEEKTIAPAEERKEVIEEAGKYGKQTPRDDHAAVVRKLKKQSAETEQATDTPFIIKEVPKKKAAVWSHVTDEKEIPAKAAPATKSKTPVKKTGPKMDMRGVAIAPTVEKRVKKDISKYKFPAPKTAAPKQKGETRPIPHTQAKQTEVIPKKTKRVTAPETIARTSDLVPQPPIKKKQEPKTEKSGWSFFISGDIHEKVGKKPKKQPAPLPPTTKPLRKTAEELIPKTPKEEPSEPLIPPQKDIPKKTRSLHSEKPDETTATSFPSLQSVPIQPHSKKPAKAVLAKKRKVYRFRAIAFILAGIIGIAGGVSAVFYITGLQKPEQPSTVVPSISSFFPIDTQTPVLVPKTKSEFLTAFETAVQEAAPGIHQLYPVIVHHADEVPVAATTEEVLAVLKPKIRSDFRRSLEKRLMIGSVTTERNEPFIVLKSDTFDTAFAGMISWEQYLSEDLAPLFGSTVSETFTDGVSGNRDVRILYGPYGGERIVYSFVNHNMIVITGSTGALAKIVERIQ